MVVHILSVLAQHCFNGRPNHQRITVQGLPISTSSYPHPVVLVSHGVGGNRMVHSCLCCELASQVKYTPQRLHVLTSFSRICLSLNDSQVCAGHNENVYEKHIQGAPPGKGGAHLGVQFEGNQPRSFLVRLLEGLFADTPTVYHTHASSQYNTPLEQMRCLSSY